MKENSNGNDTNVGSIENSIEEDIKLLQDETSSLVLFFKCKGSEKYKIALEHILSDYKRVLKENKEYYKQLDLDYTEKNFISKQKIKAKIEKLDIAILECEYSDDDSEEYKKEVEKDKLELLKQKRVLQELLEKEDSKNG